VATVGARPVVGGESEAPVRFPDAHYFIAASRLRPGLDGGYTVATLQRAMQFEQFAGVVPTLLTFDVPSMDGVLEGFRELGLTTPGTRIRNLFAELRATPSLVRDAVLHPLASGVDEADGGADVVADDGTRVLRLPFVQRVDWFRADAEIAVFAADGTVLGALHGFGELYRLWVDALVAEARGADDREVVIVSEAKQVGELLVGGPRDYTLVHTVHNAHTEPPYAWDSPMNTLWAGWFEVIDAFDGVVWLTQAQRADVVRRFGEHDGWAVIPHPALVTGEPAPASGRDPHRVVMIARLAEQKRVEHAIRVWPAVLAGEPRARLEVYGDGPLRGELEALIAELGLGEAITLHGYQPRAADEVRTAAMLLVTSRHEGWPLSITEALAAGCPVVSYDIPYGPAEMIEPGVSGELVPAGDLAALADAVLRVVGRPERIAAASAAASAWASTHGPERAMSATAELVSTAIGRARMRRARRP